MSVQEEFEVLATKVWSMTPKKAEERFREAFPECDIAIQVIESVLYVTMEYKGKKYSTSVKPEDAYKR